MKDFKDMMADTTLHGIEDEIKKQFASIKDHPNRMKLAVMAAIIAEEAMNVVDSIQLQQYVKQLRDRLDTTKNEYEKKRDMLEIHRKQNFLVASSIEEAKMSTDRVHNDIVSLLADYDEQISQIAKARDKLPIEDILTNE